MRLNTLATTLIAVMAGSLSARAQQGPAPVPTPNPQAVQNYGRLPLTFEANQGQSAAPVKFLSRGHGYSAFLTAGGLTLNLRTPRAASQSNASGSSASNSQSASTTLQFRLNGANSNPAVVGEDPQPGRVNYFLGKDRTKWHTNLPTYGKVRYKNVYPGIDLVYYGNHQQLEYDFAVAPGVNPNQIQFEIAGANQVSLDQDGNLVLGTNESNLKFQSPVVYQESNGQRVPVVGSYVMKDSSHIGFQVGGYDPNKPLVIDPVLVYSTYLGGSGTDQAAGIAVDGAGNVYIAGYTDSANFPIAALGSLPTNADHVFVAKLDATGSNLIYADYLGGSGDDYGVALVLDSANNVYVTGSTTSNDFPVVKAYQSQVPGPYSGFLTQVSADGSSLLYSTYLGGNKLDVPVSIAIDALNEVHVAGYTMSQNFPTANAFQNAALANQGGVFGLYGFLTKFSADGSSLVYSTFLAGSSTVAQNCGTPCYPEPYSAISAVAVDANGNAYVTGNTDTSNFPTTTGAYLATNSTQQDATLGFVSKFGSTGNFEYSTYLYGSSGNPVGMSAIAVDGSGSAYVTGTAQSDGTFPITSTSICDPGSWGFGCSYAFVTKFDPTGSTLLYSTFLGPNNYASPQSISIDSSGDAYVLSSTFGGAFQTNNAIESYTSQGDLLLVEIDPTAGTQLFSTYLGGTGDDFPSGMALDAAGNIYVAGSTDAADLPTTPGVLQTQLGGDTDAFVMKIGTASAPYVTLSPSSLQFAALPVSSTSQLKTVLLRNMGSSDLSITSIIASGDFAEFDTCGNNVPAASSCTLSISFTPSATGARSGAVTIQDNAVGAPHAILLTGIGEGGSNTNPAPNAILIPGALTFSSVPVGRSGISQSVTLTNAGNAALTLSNLQITGDYSQTNNCPGSLSSGSACTITVVFTPTAEGTRSGSLTISDNASGSPQSVTMSGIGAQAELTVSPASLSFANVPMGQTGATQAINLTNTGNAALTISAIQISGDFGQTNNCSVSLAAGATCTINVAFTPSAVGTRTGIVTVTDGAQGSPQSVSLSGTGTEASLTVTPNSLAFGSVPLRSSSNSQQVTLTNMGNGSLTINNLQITGDYKQTNNCSTTLAAGSSCTVNVVFTPSATETRSGSLTITDTAGTPQTVALSGTGSDFTLTSSTSSNTIQPGATASYTLSASTVGGSFPNAVSFSCSGLPANATCGFSPSTVTPGSNKANTVLTIETTDSTADNIPAIPARQKPMNGLWMQIQGLGVFGMVLAGGKKRSKKTLALVLLALLVLGMVFMTGCAGGTGIAPQTQQTTPTSQSYTITITGTSGSLQHTVPVTLTIQ